MIISRNLKSSFGIYWKFKDNVLIVELIEHSININAKHSDKVVFFNSHLNIPKGH